MGIFLCMYNELSFESAHSSLNLKVSEGTKGLTLKHTSHLLLTMKHKTGILLTEDVCEWV